MIFVIESYESNGTTFVTIRIKEWDKNFVKNKGMLTFLEKWGNSKIYDHSKTKQKTL